MPKASLAIKVYCGPQWFDMNSYGEVQMLGELKKIHSVRKTRARKWRYTGGKKSTTGRSLSCHILLPVHILTLFDKHHICDKHPCAYCTHAWLFPCANFSNRMLNVLWCHCFFLQNCLYTMLSDPKLISHTGLDVGSRQIVLLFNWNFITILQTQMSVFPVYL